MKIKKAFCIVMCLIMCLPLFSGCVSGGEALLADSADITFTEAGQTRQIRVHLGDADVTGEAEWKSDKDSVCTVVEGLLTAVAKGTAKIKATYDGQAVEIKVTVNIESQTLALTLDTAQVTLSAVGATKQVNAFFGETDITADATWTTTRAAVATVSGGLITAVGNGTATIRANYSGKQAQVSVSVIIQKKEDTELWVDKETIVLDSKTGSATVKAYTNEILAPDAVWVSDNPAVATVTDGVVTAKEWGYTNIRVTATIVEDEDEFLETIIIPVTVQRWDDAPVVKNTFFDDFSTLTSTNWYFVNYGWGQNGVSGYNGLFTANGQIVKAEGATGGITILPSYGKYNANPAKRGQGTCLISSNSYGPGLYETRVKIVPRFGPCSAIWPYYTNSNYGWNMENRQEYTEIDIIEIPATGRGFHAYGGVTYTKYYYESEDWQSKTPLDTQPSNLLKRSSSGVTMHSSLSSTGGAYTGGSGTQSPLNDGEWHIYAAEWRTDPETGNRGVSYLLDGKEVAFTPATPEYTAQLWIGNWFPDNAKSWLGDDDFDEAFMYVDWVRVKEYDDPINVRAANLGGCIGAGTAENLFAKPLPKNNYISNGKFEIQGTSANNALGWTFSSATRNSSTNVVTINSGGKINQLISAQYNNYEFDLAVTAAAASGGTVKVYAEYYRYSYGSGGATGNANIYGGSSNENTSSRINAGVLVGKSAELIFNSTSAETKNLIFKLNPDIAGNEINNIRIVVEAVGGAGTVTNAQMYLLKDKK